MQLKTEDNSYPPVNTFNLQPTNFNPTPEITINELGSSNNFSALLKIFLVIFIFTATGGLSFFAVSKATLASKLQEINNQQLLFSAPLEKVDWEDLGTVSEPKINLPIQTQNGYQNVSFLLDSGAVISSLPRELAAPMGQDLAFLKRTTFKGFGNQTSFAYHSNMSVKMGDSDVTLPVVFTESSATQALLGRKGFFDNYSITFNHIMQTVEIRR